MTLRDLEPMIMEGCPSHGCDCSKCRELCYHNPGWFSPEEAEDAIVAGLGDSMMLDFVDLDGDDGKVERVFALMPASPGYARLVAPVVDFTMASENRHRGGCVMETGGMCRIHASGFKPFECRYSFGCSKNDVVSGLVLRTVAAAAWVTPAGKTVVGRWCKEYMNQDALQDLAEELR